MKPTLSVQLAFGASVLPRQFSLTTEKSAAVAAPPSSSSARIRIALSPLGITSGASPSLVTWIGDWLSAAGVPLGTEEKNFGLAFSDGAGSALHRDRALGGCCGTG